MSIDVYNARPSSTTEIRNGNCVVSTGGRGTFSKTHQVVNDIAKRGVTTPVIGDIEEKYDDRFDIEEI